MRFFKKKVETKPKLTGFVEERVESWIKSCSHIKHLCGVEKSVDLAYFQFDVSPSQLEVFTHMLKVQRWFLERGLRKGMLVVAISNSDKDVIVATLEDYDYNLKSSPGISYIRVEHTLELLWCFSILIPYENQQQVYELNKMSGKDRWNKYCLETNKIL